MPRHLRKLLFGEETLKLELLKTPIRALGLRVEGSWLAPLVRRVQREVRERGFVLRPIFYLSNEYGTVEGKPNIGLGFWDTSEPLRELNREFRGFCWTREEAIQVIRHEYGHAFCYAYRLFRRRDFRETFEVHGHFFHSYPATTRFKANPWSRDFVNPGGDYYAQLHPDEDFAETFAEWLRLGSTWRRRYRHKPGAIEKLQLVERVVGEVARGKPDVDVDPDDLHVPIDEISETVAGFFRASSRKYLRRAAGYIDRELSALVRGYAMNGHGTTPLADFVGEHTRPLVRQVSRTAGVDEGVVRNLCEKVRDRAGAMGLGVPRERKADALVGLAALFSSLATRYALVGRLR